MAGMKAESFGPVSLLNPSARDYPYLPSNTVLSPTSKPFFVYCTVLFSVQPTNASIMYPTFLTKELDAIRRLYIRA